MSEDLNSELAELKQKIDRKKELEDLVKTKGQTYSEQAERLDTLGLYCEMINEELEKLRKPSILSIFSGSKDEVAYWILDAIMEISS